MDRLLLKLCVIFLPLFILLSPGLAAQCAKTEFTTGFGPWEGAGEATWSLDDGAARCTFPQSLLPMQTQLTVDTPCEFTGSYQEGDISLIGFDLRSWEVQPASISIELRRGTNYLRCYMSAGSTTGGQWRTYFAALEPLAPMPGWRGSIPMAEHTLQSVERVTLTIWGGSPNSGQSFDVDNIFVCSRPRSTFMALGANPQPNKMATVGDEATGPTITWTGLHPGLVYHVETAPNPRGPWVQTGSITALTSTASVTLPAGNGTVARLGFEPYLGP